MYPLLFHLVLSLVRNVERITYERGLAGLAILIAGCALWLRAGDETEEDDEDNS